MRKGNMALDKRTWILSACLLLMSFIKPVACNWNNWGEWSEGPCSVTCGEGDKVVSRTRFCLASDNAACAGPRVDKKVVSCSMGTGCGDLECYECNVYRYGKTTSCKEPKILTNCRACLKTFTKVRLHDRLGYTKDSIVESRLCVRQRESNIWEEDECVYHRNNGGFTVMCQCFSDRCNAGVRQAAFLSPYLFIGFANIVFHLF